MLAGSTVGCAKRGSWRLLLLFACSCAASADRRGTPGYVLVEEPGEELVRLPCHVSEDSFQGLRVAAFDDEHAPKWRLPYGGISGSPVYDAQGRPLGGTPRSFVTNGYAGFLVRPSSEWEDLLKIGRALGTPVARALPDPVDGELGPGRKLGAYLVWGDAYSGSPGAISMRDGDEVILLSHEYRTFGALGPCVLALIRTPVVAFAPHGDEVEMMHAPGAVVGTATYDDHRGVYGILGAEPPHVRLAVAIETRALPQTFERGYAIAKHPSLCRTGVAWALGTALASYGLDHDLFEAGVRLEADGELLEDRSVRPRAGESLADAIVRFVQEVAADGVLAYEEIGVAIELWYPEARGGEGGE